MRLVRILIAVLLAAFVVPTGAQEKVLTVTEQELRAAATQKVEPDYPAVARQIRLEGAVELQVVIDPSGHVEKVTFVSGNKLLRGNSESALRRWVFKPFSTGSEPARATGPIRFNFQM